MHDRKPIVVVVENDIAVCKALERLLRASDYAVETFASAELFLKRTNAAQVDCLVFDINLDGMSGIELYRKLRVHGAPPVIFISGRNDEAAVAAAAELKCIAYLHKPFESHALLRAIATALDRSAFV